ncbi:SIR2 family protein [Catellatospora sp. NPDC049609]|uniref:SIR2 family protein n=1 Tax=Catellatospora sp. NPDC049609 TaxID=3155505 RepID=UPI00343E5769
MDDLLPAGRPAFDARISLATAMHAQPGVYALLLGSGTSTGVGVPTGWGVVTALVAKVAAAAGEQVPTEADIEQWWSKHGDGAPLGYSALLESLASTPAARRALLASFFEPTSEERAQGVKVPGAAHRAIAQLVARGAVRVIVTTNFDRLIEQALEAQGIFPQVIATPAAIEGMEPLPHARCTVIKLHGDYARTDQLNTVEELSAYVAPLRGLLERVLDEYGLVVAGWSGDWDHGLVAALEGTRSRRYPLFWASRGELGQIAKRLVAQHRAHVITGATAEQFFPDLVNRLEALDDLADPPLTKAMAVARLKRLLPDPVKHIEVADLFDTEIRRLREHLRTLAPLAPDADPAAVQRAHDEVRTRCDTLMRLLAHGVFLDRDRQHTALWVRVVEQLMRARQQPADGHDPRWTNLQHYPALLALKTASLAAVASYHDDVLLRLLRRPTWRIQAGNGHRPVSALDALHDCRVLDFAAVNAFPRWHGTVWRYPQSRLLREETRPVLLPLVGDEDSFLQLYARTEYRTALAQSLFGVSGGLGPAPGGFAVASQWGPDGTLYWEADFRENADRDVWERTPLGRRDGESYGRRLAALADALRAA